MAKKAAYTEESISQLKGADRVRKRPAVIFGSDGIDGCQHAIFEILSNSIDEAREGFGNKIIVTRYLDKSIEVQDFGRGIPMDYNEKEQRYNWELVFCELYAGGKYNTNSGGSYEYSLGLNGLGLCSTQYASEYMDAEIHKNGIKYIMHFKEGNPVGELIREPYSKKDTGSRIHWKPDLKVFTDIDVPLSYYQETIKRQSVVNAGVRFILKDQTGTNTFDTYEYIYENGIEDYVREFVGENDAMTAVQVWQTERKGRDRADKPEYKVKINAALCFSNKKQLKEYYHNSSFLEHGGAPEKAVKSAFVSQIDAYLKANSKYLKTDGKISFQDVEDCLVLVVSSFSTQTSYENQTKKAITNKFIQEAMTDFFRHQLEVYFIENPLDAEKIANQVLVNMRSRVKAESTRLNLKKTLQSSNDLTNRVEKFVSCRSRDPERRELYIVEGDSAMTSCKLGRDAEFQAIIPVRGKTLNCLQSDYDRIFKNEIIVDLLKVIGCGVEVGGKGKTQDAFDMSQLKWSKIIICTDADEDGYQIRTLILTIFYRLLPTLIKEGRVYIAESPLFEITCKDKIYFAYDENEKQKIVSGFGGAKYTLQRSKGLGENEPDMMWQTTMNPETRRLIKIMEADRAKTEYIFETLLGDDLPERKKFIAEYGREYLAEADI